MCLRCASVQACDFMLAAETLQKANANGGNGGNGVDLGKSFPDSFVLGALAGTLAAAQAKLTPAQLAPK